MGGAMKPRGRAEGLGETLEPAGIWDGGGGGVGWEWRCWLRNRGSSLVIPM